VLYLRQFGSPSNLIPKDMAIFIYPPSILSFAFMYSHHNTTFFNDQFSVKLQDKADILKRFHFESVKFFRQSNLK